MMTPGHLSFYHIAIKGYKSDVIHPTAHSLLLHHLDINPSMSTDIHCLIYWLFPFAIPLLTPHTQVLTISTQGRHCPWLGFYILNSAEWPQHLLNSVNPGKLCKWNTDFEFWLNLTNHFLAASLVIACHFEWQFCIWVRSWELRLSFYLVLIAKPGNKTAAVPWSDPYRDEFVPHLHACKLSDTRWCQDSRG